MDFLASRKKGCPENVFVRPGFLLLFRESETSERVPLAQHVVHGRGKYRNESAANAPNFQTIIYYCCLQLSVIYVAVLLGLKSRSLTEGKVQAFFYRWNLFSEVGKAGSRV